MRIRWQAEYPTAWIPGLFHPDHKRLRLEEITIPSLIIDGYNLIGISHRDLEAQRERLIELLIGYRKRKGHEIVAVFDGWKGGKAVEHSSVRGGIRVIYSRLGEKADAVIKHILSSDRREWIVVTSDREIAGHAWATGSIPVDADKFLPFLEAAEPAVQRGTEVSFSDEEEEMDRSGRGRTRQLSKREKAIQRALGKL